jgi:hypothetical protein
VIRLDDWTKDPANAGHSYPSDNGHDPSFPKARDQLIRRRIKTGYYHLPQTEDAIARKLEERWSK